MYNNALLMSIVPTNLKLNGATSATGLQSSQPSQSKTVWHKYCISIQDRWPPQKQNKTLRPPQFQTATQPRASPRGLVCLNLSSTGQINDNTRTHSPPSQWGVCAVSHATKSRRKSEMGGQTQTGWCGLMTNPQRGRDTERGRVESRQQTDGR